MTKYLCHMQYSAEGMKGLLAEGGYRRGLDHQVYRAADA